MRLVRNLFLMLFVNVLTIGLMAQTSKKPSLSNKAYKAEAKAIVEEDMKSLHMVQIDGAVPIDVRTLCVNTVILDGYLVLVEVKKPHLDRVKVDKLLGQLNRDVETVDSAVQFWHNEQMKQNLDSQSSS